MMTGSPSRSAAAATPPIATAGPPTGPATGLLTSVMAPAVARGDTEAGLVLKRRRVRVCRDVRGLGHEGDLVATRPTVDLTLTRLS